MNTNKTILYLGSLALLAVVLTAFVQVSVKKATGPAVTPLGSSSQTGPEAALPQATGNIDDLSQALDLELSNEQALLNSQEADADVVADTPQEVTDFGQSYDENEIQ